MKKQLMAAASVVGAAIIGATCAACSFGGRNMNDDIGDLTERKGEITIWWPGSTTEMAAINQAKADYTALYPDVKINIIGQSTADFYSAYMLACAGGSAPDIAYVDHVYVQTLAQYGYIANLSSAGFESLEDTFVSTLWEPGFFNGKLYGLPMSANILVTVYNKTIIANAQGVTADNITLPANYDEFIALAELIKETGKTPITIPAGTGNNSMAAMTYLAYVNRCGGTGILSSDLKTSIINSDECKEAAKKLYNLGSYSTSTFSEAEFEHGNVAFIEMGSWKISDYEKYSEEWDWEVGYTTAIPFTDGGNAGSTIGLYDLVVTNKQGSGNKMALAADFVKFVTTTDKYQLAFSTVQNLLPTTKTALTDDYYSGEVWQVFTQQLQNAAVVRPGSPVWSDIETALGNLVTKCVQRKFTTEAKVEAECVAISNQIQQALDEIYN